MLENILSSPSSWGLLILRLALGITFWAHGWMKADPNGAVKGPANFAVGLKQMGVPLPLFFAWIVLLLETVGSILLILGLATPILAIGIAFNMLVAALLTKRGMMNAKFMDPQGTGWEFEFVLLTGGLVLFFTGAGSISLDYLFGLSLPNNLVLYGGLVLIVILAVVALFISQGRRPASVGQSRTAKAGS